jgi:hypothetical protein
MLTNNNYYIDIFLTNNFNVQGMLETITTNEIIGSLTSITFSNDFIQPEPVNVAFDIEVSGLTISKINDIKDYSGNIVVGLNGVYELTSEYVKYIIDDIYYQTFFEDNLTIYIVYKKTNEFMKSFVIKNENLPFSDIRKTVNGLLIERNNISVYTFLNRLSNSSNLEDLNEIFNS